MNINVHRVVTATLERPKRLSSGVWVRSLVLVDDQGHKMELVMYSQQPSFIEIEGGPGY